MIASANGAQDRVRRGRTSRRRWIRKGTGGCPSARQRGAAAGWRRSDRTARRQWKASCLAFWLQPRRRPGGPRGGGSRTARWPAALRGARCRDRWRNQRPCSPAQSSRTRRVARQSPAGLFPQVSSVPHPQRTANGRHRRERGKRGNLKARDGTQLRDSQFIAKCANFEQWNSSRCEERRAGTSRAPDSVRSARTGWSQRDEHHLQETEMRPT